MDNNDIMRGESGESALIAPSSSQPSVPHPSSTTTFSTASTPRRSGDIGLSCFLAGEGRAMPVPTSQQPATEDGCRERALQQRQSTRNPGVDCLLLKSQRELSDGDVKTISPTKQPSVAIRTTPPRATKNKTKNAELETPTTRAKRNEMAEQQKAEAAKAAKAAKAAAKLLLNYTIC
ncbi:hypothetical protein MHU86_20621 [Fragilaria crotonensis]|nr:hypothetical protein MHU86_20621 [Fragilaria crotonensis]